MKTGWLGLGRLPVLLVVCGLVAPAWGQQYPTKPIRVIVPSSPGGGLDFVAREGSEPAVSTPEQLGVFLADEVARLGKIVRASRAGK